MDWQEIKILVNNEQDIEAESMVKWPQAFDAVAGCLSQVNVGGMWWECYG